MEAKNKYGIIIAMMLSFLFFSSLAYAAQPSVVITKPTEGLEIIYPLIDTIPKNTAHIFNFHIGNVSNGRLMDNSTPISCYFHLYNISGEHVCDLYYTQTNYDHKYDIEAQVTAQNFTNAGNYVIWFGCNTSTLGGQMQERVYVTEGGAEETTENSVALLAVIIGITLALAVTTMLFAYLYANTDAVQKHLKILFLGAALLMGISSISIQEVIIRKYDSILSTTLADSVGSIYNLGLWVFRIVMVIVVVWIIWAAARNAASGGKYETDPDKGGR